MEGEHLLMSTKERQRKSVMERLASGEWSQLEAASYLEISVRQVKRIYRRYRLEGDRGLLHRSRGRRSARAAPETFRAQVLACYGEFYEGLGPTLAAEKLAEDGLSVDHETLRRWLIADGKWQRRRTRGQHRERRQPKEHFGELLQMDGSHHAWFGQERPRCCLMSLVDDATGRAMTLMAQEETTEAAMRLLQQWIERHGVPKALYTDRKSVYITERAPTLEEQLAGKEPLTHFGHACQKLGIRISTAYSPQAKGRVERKHGLYQDRLVHELRLRKIETIEACNRLLHEGFDESLNEKFARRPRSRHDFHRKLPKNVELRDIFCYEETRVLANDWTISYCNQTLQILKLNDPLPRPKEKITVRNWLDGSVHLLYRGKPVLFRVLAQPPAKNDTRVEKTAAQKGKNKPPHNHPWRRYPRP